MDPQQALEKYFGFREFREPQGEVISQILQGNEVFVVMPTGGGKSLCYQLPAVLLSGVTVVVSPLLALMKDQVDSLQARGISATLINSTITSAEQQRRIRQMRDGEFQIVYIAPERFRSRSFLEALGQVTVALFAVDEAHCMSQWGHDFRPDYFRLGEVLHSLGRPQVAAFTATATPEVRADIVKRLGLENPALFVAGFARPNLRFSVTETERESTKFDRLRSLVNRHKTGIVYCATRKRVDQVADFLRECAVKVVSYHGGIHDEAREAAQNQFTQNQCDVVVATNAFGMGIDRPDLRFVAHFEIPGSLEAYYQEAGRAGRDGEPAECELLFNYADTRVQEFFINGSNPTPELIRRVYQLLQNLANPAGEVVMSVQDLAARIESENNDMAVHSAITILDRTGIIDRYDIPGKRIRGTRLLKSNLSAFQLPIDTTSLREKEKRDRAKLKSMVDYAYGRECRQKLILRYFGDPDLTDCGACDICASKRSQKLRRPTPDEMLIVRKALSGVARLSTRSEQGYLPRFGRNRVIQMLVGSRSKEVVEAGFDQLKSYGALNEKSPTYLHELFRELEEAGLIYSTGGQYPTISLTERGVEVMHDRGTMEIVWPQEIHKATRKKAKAEEAPEMPFDPSLYDEMKKIRTAMANALGGLPAYLIFPDETLKAFARIKPQSVDAARQIRGVGEIKAQRYLPPFLEAIRACIAHQS